jgi:hypothetical protein
VAARLTGLIEFVEAHVDDVDRSRAAYDGQKS